MGDGKISNIAVSTAEKFYEQFGGTRMAEKVVTYCKAMWKRMKPHHPELFRTDTPIPWHGVTLKRRKKQTNGHINRETVYAFASFPTVVSPTESPAWSCTSAGLFWPEFSRLKRLLLCRWLPEP